MQGINLKQKISNRLEGFTLVEVLAVIVIIAMMAAAGGGYYVGTYRHMLTKKSARDFFLAAKYARILAIENQSQCKLQLDAENHNFALVVDKLNEQTSQTEQTAVRDSYFKPVELKNDVTFEKILIIPVGYEQAYDEENSQTITFLPNGTSQSAIIQIGNGKNHYTISILAATGKAIIFEGTAEKVKLGSVDLEQQAQGI